ncbi:response regulator transcription factor [Enterococcus sp. 669A]|uniref:Response regulator transcription factor n=1 Tax=Candidatus Enterococcus moelleringii TaxID=2815325 RepID=A0ABS3L6M4_9ENTE|nr:response regulator transcription factor [Enterococcus sp. 669A]MBO1305271.1 response regulator transcription factor [Enterococcus sp. 669A]
MKLLLCEDEDKMRELLKRFLENEGYSVVEASDGEEALEKFYEEKLDLAILDWMMPKMNGLEVAQAMKRERNIKILMLTAKNMPEDEVEALVAGVDDYLAKPFHAQVLLVRVAKLLGVIKQDIKQPLVFVPNEKRVLLHDQELELTKREYDMLYYLYQNQGQALTREQILLSVWGLDHENDERTVDSFIRMLRDKLGKEFIQTVYGTGYRFELPKK